MKKTLLTVSTLAMLLAQAPRAEANHNDAATAGAIIAGAVGLALIADAYSDGDCRPTYRHHRNNRRHYSQAPVYCAPVTYSQSYCAPVRTWVPGYYTNCQERVWVPTRTERIWVEPQYSYEWRCGRRVSVLVCQGRYECQTIPGHYERQSVRSWVPGRWSDC